MLSKTGRFLRIIVPQGLTYQPRGMCFYAGELWFGDTANHRIVAINPATGRALRSFGKPGTGGGEFDWPVGVCVMQGKLYVCDLKNNRIQVFA